MNQKVLGCPVFKIQTRSHWQKVFSINLVNAINTEHFVHMCRGEECTGGNHDVSNSLYTRNMFFFKAV
jgi:hypothetical protein